MNLLIVEDDKKTAALLASALQEAGFKVSHASDGESGLQTATEGTFDALLVDIMLPRRDGLSLVRELLIALTLPFALSDGVLSLGSLVGFVTVLGIAARNGILLVSHYRHLETEEGHAFGLPLVLQGSEERLIPILMTAATAALALLPLVLKGDVPGNEIERPLALVILGGLVTSTLLNLFLLPALYARFGKVPRPPA